MRLNSIVRLATVASLLAFTKSSPGTVASTLTVIDTPAQIHLFTAIQGDAPPKRLLRTYETNDQEDEERFPGLGKVADLIKAGTSKVDDIKYSSLVNKLKLGDNFEDVVKSTQMEQLSKFVTKLNRNKDPSNQISFIGKLSEKYGDDVVARTLVKLERSVQTTPKLESVVTQLRNEQVTYWLKNDKSVLEVFNLLKLGGDGHRAFMSRKLEVLEDYIHKFNVKTSGDASLVSVMAEGFGSESRLVTLLAVAKMDHETVAKARELEWALLTKWRNEKLSQITVWSRLKFGESAENALSNGKLKMFYKFVKQNYPNSEKLVINRFTAKYGEVEVAQALVNGRDRWDMKDVATKLQGQQLKGWLNSGKSADDIFNSLKIKSDDYKFVTSWKMETLDEYIKLFNSKQTNPQDKMNRFGVVRKGFGGDGDLARAVTKALEGTDTRISSAAKEYEEYLFKRWLQSEVDPINIYARFLNVDAASAGTLEKTIVSRYRTYYNGVNPPQMRTDPRRS